MIWESWSDFFAMGGYGLYVWGSVLTVSGCVAGELLALRWRRKAIAAALSLAKTARRKTGRAGA